MSLDSEKELQQLKNRLKELAEKSYRQNVYTFTGFLGLAELDAYFQMERELSYAHPALFGGDQKAERQMVRFGSPEEFGYEEAYPIACIHVEPLLSKFADDFSHRDFLGALMHLGIERSCVGDIRVGDREGYLYCLAGMADFICENLIQVRHTHVRCRIAEKIAETEADAPKEAEVLVSSLRIDGCIAKVYNISRGDSLALFRDGKVFVDGRLTENNSRLLKPGEVVNVRGFGKFRFLEIKYTTKKGKLCLAAEVYR